MNEGALLEQFVRLRWTRREGGIRALAEAIPTSADTIYRWFNGTSPIDTYYLGRLAEALGVKRWEIVAAMDGEAPAADWEARLRAVEETVEELLRRTPIGPAAEGAPAPRAPRSSAG